MFLALGPNWIPWGAQVSPMATTWEPVEAPWGARGGPSGPKPIYTNSRSTAIGRLLLVSTKSVARFQQGLQKLVATAAKTGHPKWTETLSPRLPLSTHPLVSLI